MKRYRAKRGVYLWYKDGPHVDGLVLRKGQYFEFNPDDFEEVEEEKEIEPVPFDGSYTNREYHLTHKVNEVIKVVNELRERK